MLVRRPPSAVLNLFRSQMLAAFREWIITSKPTPAEISTEIEATANAMRQIAEVV